MSINFKGSHITSDQSAVWVGLNAFVFSPSISIDQLKEV